MKRIYSGMKRVEVNSKWGDVIATIVAGVPCTIVVVVAIFAVILYAMLFAWSADNNHDSLTWTLIIFVILFLCTGMSYFFGSVL